MGAGAGTKQQIQHSSELAKVAWIISLRRHTVVRRAMPDGSLIVRDNTKSVLDLGGAKDAVALPGPYAWMRMPLCA